MRYYEIGKLKIRKIQNVDKNVELWDLSSAGMNVKWYQHLKINLLTVCTSCNPAISFLGINFRDPFAPYICSMHM